MKVAIIGTGRVGSAQARGFLKAGHEVVMGSRDPAKTPLVQGTGLLSQKDAVRFGEVVVLAVPNAAMKDVLQTIGLELFRDKIVMDVSNVIGANGEWAMGFTTSAAEEIAKMLPGAKVVKAFNTVFAVNQDQGKIGGERLVLLVAGDDPKAKGVILEYGKALGFDSIDAGPLSSARYLEPMGMLIIRLGLELKMGVNIGYRLVHA